MESSNKALSVIVPVFNSEKTLNELIERTFAALPEFKDKLEIILVSDGSTDGSETVIKKLAASDKRIKLISFFRNFGQANALMAGLRASSGDVCVILDDDLQHPPEEIPKLLKGLGEGHDFVFGVPAKPRQSLGRRLMRVGAFFTADLLLENPKGLYYSSFLAARRPIVQYVTRYTGTFPYIAGLLMRASTNGANVIVQEHSRKQGRSQYSPSKLIRVWLNSFMSFSILPLRTASVGGACVAFAGFVILGWILAQKLLYGVYMAGWPSVIGAILLFSGIQLLALGIVGEYIGRMFILQSQAPQYCVKETVNYQGEQL